MLLLLFADLFPKDYITRLLELQNLDPKQLLGAELPSQMYVFEKSRRSALSLDPSKQLTAERLRAI